MLKYSLCLVFILFFSPNTIAQNSTNLSAKYILDDNDSFALTFFNAPNVLSLYNALSLNQYLKFSPAPSSPTSPGITGQLAYEDNFLYICVGTDTWRRARMGTW